MSNPTEQQLAEQQAFREMIVKKAMAELAREELAKEIVVLEFRKLNVQQTVVLSKILDYIKIIGKEHIDEDVMEKMLTKYNEMLALTSSVITDVDKLMT